MEARTYTIPESEIGTLKKKYLKTFVPLMLLIILAVTGFSVIRDRQSGESLDSVPYSLGAVFLVFCFILFRAMRKTEAFYKAFSISIDANSIYRDQLNTPTIHIYRSEITEISQVKNGSLIIRTSDKHTSICVPKQLSKFDDLYALLSQDVTINTNPPVPFGRKFVFPIIIGCLALLGITFASSNKYLVSITGVSLIALIIYGLVQSWGNKNLDKSARRSFIYLFILMAALAYKIVATWIEAS